MPGAVSMPIEEALAVLRRLLTMAEGCVNADELLTREERAAVATILDSVVSSKEDMTLVLNEARGEYACRVLAVRESLVVMSKALDLAVASLPQKKGG